MVVHHTRKDSGNPSTPIERIMGSQGIGATIETAIVLEQRPGSKDIIAHVVGKEVEGGEFAYRWDSPGFSFQGTPDVATLGSFQEKCYAFIKQHPRCMQKAIVDALDTDKGSVSRAVAKLIERGLVEKDQRDALMASQNSATIKTCSACARAKANTQPRAPGTHNKKVDKRVDVSLRILHKDMLNNDFFSWSGAAEGTRTPDPIITNDVLYQLSYSGHGRAHSKVVRACVDIM